MLKYYSPKEIYTYTFGPENSLDFRIGNLIAKKFGTTHLAHAITIDDFSLKKEIFWAKTLNIPISLFYHPPINIVNEFINDNIWFGFMGDPLAGSHLDLKLNNFEESINKFFLKYGLLNINMAKKYQINTTFIESKIRETIDPSIPINIFENIDFSIRQSQFIKPHVVFSKLYTLPFVDERWIEEMLIIPNKYRNNESYYRQFLINAYPKIFSYPCKNNYGYPLSSKKSIFYRIKNKFFINNKKADFLNYIDYDSLLKTDNSFSHFVKDLIQDQNIIDHKMVLDDYNMGKLKSSFILNLASICILKNIGIIK